MEPCKENIGSCENCLKKNISLFKDLDGKSLKLLNKGRVKREYKVGEHLFSEADTPESLICLNKGKVKLAKQSRINDEFIVGFKKPVDFIAINDLFTAESYSNHAIAIEPSSTCSIKKEHLLEVMKNKPEFSVKIVEELSREVIKLRDKMVGISQKKMESRLASSLFELLDVFGVDEDGFINVQLKRKEIASISNMNTANGIRYLGKFEKEGLIQMDKRRIKVLNEQALLDIINDN